MNPTIRRTTTIAAAANHGSLGRPLVTMARPIGSVGRCERAVVRC
jgi:hypothetical protein